MSISIRDLTVITEQLPAISPALWREVLKHARAQDSNGDSTLGCPALHQLLHDKRYTSISHLFCNLVIFIKQRGRGTVSFTVLRVVMLNVWHSPKASARCTTLPASANADLTPWQGHLSALLHSSDPHHHTRLHVLLYAELAADHAAASELAWLTQQPCWAHCNPWLCPPGRILVAQAALVAIIQAAVCLVHSETSQMAAQALSVLELVQQSMYSQPGLPVVDGIGTGVEADPDGYLSDSMAAVAAHQPHSGPGSRRLLDMCLLVGDTWCLGQHGRYPRRFQEAVRTLLLCAHYGCVEGGLGMLGADDVLRIVVALAKPLSCWLQ